MAESKLVKITVAPDELVAQMWCEALANEGIRCLLKKTDALSVAYLASAAPYSVELYVRAEDAEAARRLLDEFGAEGTAGADEHTTS